VIRSVAVGVALASALAIGAGPAHAHDPEKDPDAESAPVEPVTQFWPMAGALTAVGTLAVGGAFIAQDTEPRLQMIGTSIALLGFAAAPFVAHTRSGRCERALIFGLTSVATSLTTLAIMQVSEPYDPKTLNHDRIPFGIAFTTAFFAAAAGVIDGFLVAPGRDRRP
jgi:hypothetical protein